MKIALFFMFSCCVLVLAKQLGDSLRHINQMTEARINLIFANAPYCLELDEMLQQVYVPRFLISTNRLGNLHQHYQENIVSVLFLDNSYERQEQQLKILNYIVVHCKHCVVLFISKHTQVIRMRWLFQWCWDNSFINALYLTVNNNFTTFTTYTPFPRIQLYNTTLSEYSKAFQKDIYNYKGYPIRFWSGFQIPRSMVYENNMNELILKGSLLRILKMFADRVNATLERVISGTNHTAPQNSEDCVQLLSAKKVDICTHMFFIDRIFHMTHPMFLLKLHILVPEARPLTIFRRFTAPFSLGVWLMLLLSLMTFTLVLGLICFYRYSKWCIDHIFLEIFASFLYLPFQLPLFSGHTRYFLHLLLLAFGFLLSTLYLAFLSSFFSANIYEKKIQNIADLRDRNISILLDKEDASILRHYEVDDELYKSILIAPSAFVDSHLFSLNPKYAYVCALDKCELILRQQKYMRRPKMTHISSPTALMWAGLLIQNHTFFEVSFNAHLQRTFEMGFIHHHTDQSFADAAEMGFLHYFHTEEHKIVVQRLDIDYYGLIAVVIITGHSIALVAFIGELIVHRYW